MQILTKPEMLKEACCITFGQSVKLKQSFEAATYLAKTTIVVSSRKLLSAEGRLSSLLIMRRLLDGAMCYYIVRRARPLWWSPAKSEEIVEVAAEVG